MGSNETKETKEFAQKTLIEGLMRKRAANTASAALLALPKTTAEKVHFEVKTEPKKTKEIVKTIKAGKTHVIEGPVRNQARNVQSLAGTEFPRTLPEGTEFKGGKPCGPTIPPQQFQRIIYSAA